MEIFKVEDLSFTYPDGNTVLKDISFSIDEGEFIVLCGETGSGKSTLARMLKRELIPNGDRTGTILFSGIEQEKLSDEYSACKIGFVCQSPEQQTVTDKVWHELAFGLENMNLPTETIRSRVAEMADYFGIEEWFDKNVCELSGGQKQMLNLASVMVMQPRLLILDEPTAQLDPIAASDFMATLLKLNRELGITVILIEHRLEEVIPVCDRLMVMSRGRVTGFDRPERLVGRPAEFPRLLYSMPSAVRLYCGLMEKKIISEKSALFSRCPMTVREGRKMMGEVCKNGVAEMPVYDMASEKKCSSDDIPALEFKHVFFRYTREGRDILHNLSFSVRRGELYCILGGNGSGKSTCLGAAANVNRIYSGTVRVFGRKLKDYRGQSLYDRCLAFLPQDVTTVFLHGSVREELKNCDYSAFNNYYDIDGLLDKHPYDLSGGEQQLIALVKLLGTQPQLLLIDEPTKGIDAYSKKIIIEVLRSLCDRGMTIVTVTHDVEFAAACGDRCAMFFRGEVISDNPPEVFFSENSFYTTAVSRMTRGYIDRAVTVEAVMERFQ